MSDVATAPEHSPEAEVERARSDYLAVSRCAHLYASPDDYDAAERSAWERLQAALDRAASTPTA